MRRLLLLALFSGACVSFSGDLALAGPDRPEEMKDAIALAEKYYKDALANPKVQADAALKEKIQKAYDAFLETDMSIDAGHTEDNEDCSKRAGRVSYTSQSRFLGFGPIISTSISYCQKLIRMPVWYQAQYVVHESIHAAELDQSDQHSEILANKVYGFECIAEGLNYDIIEAAGAAPFRSGYSLRVKSTGPTVYFDECDTLSPGLTDRAIRGSRIRVFDAVIDSKTPLSSDMDHPIRYFASVEPNMKDSRRTGEPSLLETAVQSDRADWVKFLLESTMADPKAIATDGKTVAQLIEEKKNSEMLEALRSWEEQQKK